MCGHVGLSLKHVFLHSKLTASQWSSYPTIQNVPVFETEGVILLTW